jgi:hypothetical protein
LEIAYATGTLNIYSNITGCFAFENFKAQTVKKLNINNLPFKPNFRAFVEQIHKIF